MSQGNLEKWKKSGNVKISLKMVSGMAKQSSEKYRFTIFFLYGQLILLVFKIVFSINLV